jgi:hypothetical protein
MACALGCKICKVCLLLLDLCWNGELFSDFLFGFTWLAELILAPVANCEAVAGGGVCFCCGLVWACFGFSATFNLLNLSAASVCSRMNLSTQSMFDDTTFTTSLRPMAEKE